MAFINSLYNLWPNGDEKITGLRDGIAMSAESVFAKYGIDSPLLVAHVMAQISHECGAGHDVVENLNYRADALRSQWPSHFTEAQAQAMQHQPHLIANQAYNGRMGNRPGTDDGWNFRGRGGSQTTGREGYERVAKETGLDVVNNPDILIDPKYFLLCSVADFANCGCIPYAKKDDIGAVSAALNVGDPTKVGKVIGLAQREQWLSKWKAELGSNPIDYTLPTMLRPKDQQPPILKPSPKPPLPAPQPTKPSFIELIAAFLASLFKRKS